jgi:hypothetical protein
MARRATAPPFPAPVADLPKQLFRLVHRGVAHYRLVNWCVNVLVCRRTQENRLPVVRWLAQYTPPVHWIYQISTSSEHHIYGGWQARSVREIVWMRARFGYDASGLYYMTPDLESWCEKTSCEVLARACAQFASRHELARIRRMSTEPRSKLVLHRITAKRLQY